MGSHKTKVIAIAQQKGGTGKTTTAHAIGTGLSKKGKRVLFIDLDGQRNLTYALKALDNTTPTAADILNGSATAAESIIKNPANSKAAPADLIRASDTMFNALDNDNKEWLFSLQKAIEPIKGKYDFIIIDTPPQLGKILACTMAAATDIIIPALADFFSLQGVAQICETISQAKEINPALKISGILITKYSPRKILARDTATLIEQTAQAHGTKVFKTRIRECIAVSEAIARQTDIFTYAPKSTAAQDYTNLLQEI